MRRHHSSYSRHSQLRALKLLFARDLSVCINTRRFASCSLILSCNSRTTLEYYPRPRWDRRVPFSQCDNLKLKIHRPLTACICNVKRLDAGTVKEAEVTPKDAGI